MAQNLYLRVRVRADTTLGIIDEMRRSENLGSYTVNRFRGHPSGPVYDIEFPIDSRRVDDFEDIVSQYDFIRWVGIDRRPSPIATSSASLQSSPAAQGT